MPLKGKHGCYSVDFVCCMYTIFGALDMNGNNILTAPTQKKNVIKKNENEKEKKIEKTNEGKKYPKMKCTKSEMVP